MKNVFLFMVCLFLTVNVFSQIGASKPEDIKEIKSRKLIVVLEEANNPKMLEKLNPAEQDFYKKDIEDYNTMIKDVAAKYWKFNTEIEYLTRTETDKIVKAKNKKYAYIEYNKYKVHFYNPASLRKTMKEQFADKKFPAGSDYAMSQMNIRLAEDNPLSPPVYGVHLPTPFPTKADLIICLKKMQLQFDYKLQGMKDMKINGLYKDRMKELQNKTLLICDYNVEMKEKDIKSYYPFEFKVLPKTEIDKVIENDEANYGVLEIILFDGGEFGIDVIDPQTGAEIARAHQDDNTGVKFGGIESMKNFTKNVGLENKFIINKDNLKLLAKHIKK
jgi:hypothetical protein